MKRLLSFTMILTIIISINVPIFASSDEPSSWAKEEVQSAIQNGYVPEHLQNNYQYYITRQEFSELLVTAIFTDFNKREEKTNKSTHYSVLEKWEFQTLTIDNFLENVKTTEKFTDTDSKYVKIANMLGIVNGAGDNKFNPSGLITREQACVMFVNYFQAVYSPNARYAEELDDLETASTWAKDAVAWAYEADFIKGTKAPILADITGDIITKGHFDTKSNITREQAICIISRLGKGSKNLLNHLIIRGYMKIDIRKLQSGIEIYGNKICFTSNGYDAEYDPTKQYFRTQTKLRKYVDKYTAEDIMFACTTPYKAILEVHEPAHLDRVLNGETVKYDFKVFTVTYNIDNYKLVVEKTGNYGYLRCGGLSLRYKNNGKWNRVIGVEVK